MENLNEMNFPRQGDEVKPKSNQIVASQQTESPGEWSWKSMREARSKRNQS